MSQIDPSRATPGDWQVRPGRMAMCGGEKLQTLQIWTRENTAVAKLHPIQGLPEDREAVATNARLIAASKPMAEMLMEALRYEADQFDGHWDLPLDVSGADLVDWFTDWRERVKRVLDVPG
ncbi:hypothetical protein FHR90_003398 [Endobacter medicaginis]|uniref:Uncharacterized protein n=1 Tax=Endobacter medicaginis TaxID=1181271 RepID=A0A850NHB5_9PROT|nr:hypothetical protein [Endobacter medicaginis]MBB3175542.1 hypothetical protein [Endobacter medicaginis]MCX5476585.1 hypothetical protein [Endobacter medicaginis]NVN29033.1 hypothetical protein [Endobacter medicaginis]